MKNAPWELIKRYYDRDDEPRSEIVHKFDDELLTGVLEEITHFLRGAGYHINGTLEVVEEDDRETVDDIYQEGYKDGIETALREIKNGTFNPSDHGVDIEEVYDGEDDTNTDDISGDELDLDDGYMLDGIKARSYRCEQAGSELRDLPSDDTDSRVCCETPQIIDRCIEDDSYGTITECNNCGTLSGLSNEEVFG